MMLRLGYRFFQKRRQSYSGKLQLFLGCVCGSRQASRAVLTSEVSHAWLRQLLQKEYPSPFNFKSGSLLAESENSLEIGNLKI